VVISTATVALQEQVVLRDLPDLVNLSDCGSVSRSPRAASRYVC